MDTTKIKAKLTDTKVIKKSTQLYEKYQRFIPALSFLAGFTWDSLTLTRIDLLIDNVILMIYIILAGVCIILFNLIGDNVLKRPEFLVNNKEWLPVGLQFFFGGLFSSYVVFYFQSATLSKNWLFIFLLMALLIGNEFFKDRYRNLNLLFILYFLASFSFFTFFFPVITKMMNVYIFILSGLVSVAFITGILYFLYRKSATIARSQFKKLTIIISAIFVLLNVFYYLNWIPPVPLSLKHGGIYHHVSRSGNAYKLVQEKGRWYEIFKSYDDEFHYSKNDTVFCFVAVFAPTRLDKKIYHHWQHYNNNREEWQTTDRLDYRIVGGRDGGYRGYTYKKNIQLGDWRVEVKTEEDQLLGRINFEIIMDGKTYKKVEKFYK